MSTCSKLMLHESCPVLYPPLWLQEYCSHSLMGALSLKGKGQVVVPLLSRVNAVRIATYALRMLIDGGEVNSNV